VSVWQVELRAQRLRCGAGSLDDLAPVVQELGGGRVVLVTDPGVRAAGHAERAASILARGGLDVEIFDGVAESPTSAHVEAGVEVARRCGAELLVAVGGGSAMDCAKGINFVLTNGGSIEDYWGWGKARVPLLPALAVPTTAGTGSEAQSYALISRASDHRKMACGDQKARFAAVLLDPELARTAPRPVVAAAGLDALAHAVESYVSSRRNPLSQMCAASAFSRLERALPEALNGADDPLVWEEMLLGAYLAGQAIELSMLGAAHALANPLSARYGVAHGAAVAVLLPHVVRFNATLVGPLYAELVGGVVDDAGARLAARLERLRDIAGLPARLAACGVEEEALPALARSAAEEWTGGFNPRQLRFEDFLELYHAAC
jgi:alcohol dehydrogenase